LAVEASTRAAEFARAHGANADAAHHWAVAATMLEHSAPDDHRRRLEALINAAAAHERADEMPQAQALVVTALGLARSHGDPAHVEAAASILNHASIFPNLTYGAMNSTLIGLLGECLTVLDEGARSARATVLAALSTELFHSADVDWRDDASSEAVAIARELGDPAVLARVLHARTFALKQPMSVPARREVAREIAELAQRAHLGDDIVLVGELQTALADFALGDLRAADAGLQRCRTLLDRPVGQALRSQVAYFRAHLDIIRGRHPQARRHIDDAFEQTRRSRPAEAGVIRLGQLLTIGYDDGDLPDELLAAARTDEADGYALVVRLFTAVILFDLGRRDEALERLPYARGEVPTRPLDYTTTFVDTAAANIAAETSDRVGAAALLARLAPMAGRWVAPGTGAASLGLVDLALARLHATLDRTDDARGWFEAAVAGHERLGAPAWLARSLLHQGRFLVRCGEPAAGTAALRRAAELAREHRLPIVLAQIEAT
ncbi:MAG: regulatory protein LuxR, partial [Ilumatobacteraceae bacterium]|nr:regulatory protein LuxR [Ilumatobacteraceae bacterium]